MSVTPAPERALRILIADDHGVVREGLKRMLEASSPSWTVSEASSGFQALELLRREPFDLGIFDLSMPGMNGLDLLRRVRVDQPRLPVLLLSMHAEEQYAIRAYKAGANAYVTKDAATSELIDAVRKVAAGGVYVSRSLAERMVQQLNTPVNRPAHEQLSDRELDVLRRLVAGQRPGEIAQALHLSIKTVSSHKSRIQDKLNLPTTAALIRYGMEHGLAPEAAAPSDGPP